MVIFLGFAVYFQLAANHIRHTLLQERLLAVEKEVSYICDTIDFVVDQTGGEWELEKYQDTIAFVAEQLDSTVNIYAELRDSNMVTISKRIIPEDDKWRFAGVTNYPVFMDHVLKEDSGTLIIPSDPLDAQFRPAPVVDVHLYWRWIPAGNYENRVLLIVGVTRHSIQTELSGWLVYGIIALFFVSTVSVVGSIMLLTVDPQNTQAH